MSAQAAGAEREFWPALGHHAWKAPLLANALVLGAMFLPSDGGWFWPFVAVLLGIYGAALYATRRHNHVLCGRCISEMPLDPQALVSRRDRMLRWNHREDNWSHKKRILVTVTGLIVILAVTVLSRGWMFYVFVVVWFGVYQTWDILATRTHKILEPWCPYCHRRRRRWDGFSPVPVPPDPAVKVDR